LTAIEDDWIKSRLKSDMEFSDRLIDEAYQGTTSDGLLQSKAEFMQAIARSAPLHSDARQDERRIQIFGELAVSTGVATMQSQNRSRSFRYIRIFRNKEGSWRLIASQSTRVLEA